MIKSKKTAMNNPGNYERWSDKLLADRECVLAAVQQNGMALRFASEALRADREVVLAAVQQYGRALEHASKNLRADREIVLAAVRQYGWALEYASEDLRADREVVLAAVRQNGWVLVFASDDLREEREMVIEAVQQDNDLLKFYDEVLQQDEQFVAELADVCPLGVVWRYKPQVTLVETARRAMRSKDGILLLAKQSRVSLLGEPAMMKELLLSAMEQGCLEDTLSMLVANQKKGIMNALRTVMVWYATELPDALPADMNGLNALCNLVSTAICEKGGGGEDG